MSWQMVYKEPQWERQMIASAPASKAQTVRIRLQGRRAQSLLSVASPAVLVAAFLLFWQFVVPLGVVPGVPQQYLGSPGGILERFAELWSNGYTGAPLWVHFAASVLRTLTGVALATVVGVPLGLAMGLNRVLDNAIGPIVGFLRPIPALAFIPVVVIWLGIGESSKVFVIFMSSLMFVITGAALGVRAVPRDYYLVAQNYGLRGWHLIWQIVVPPALPQILAGLRTALTIGWAVVVAAELIAASVGLGYMIRNAAEMFDVNTAYVGIVLIGIVGVIFEYGFRFLETRLLHWQVSR